jgi:nucleoside-diphosphate-sugar epimerase
VRLDDIVETLPTIARRAPRRLYNLASGRNATAGEIVRAVCDVTGATSTQGTSGERIEFPIIDIDRARADLDFAPRDPFAMLPMLVESAREELGA